MAPIDLSVGVSLLCIMIAAVFYGVLTIQCGFYFRRYKEDHWGIKAMVIAVWLLEGLHQIFATMWLYQLAIYERGHPMEFAKVSGWRLGATLLPLSVTALITHIFYARRGYILNKKLWPFSLLAIIVSLLAFSSGTAVGSLLMRLPQFKDRDRYLYLQELWLFSEASADLLVALIVVYSLRGVRTGYSHTERGVWALITYTFSTGIITTIFAALVVILLKALPASLTHPAITMILARVYSNSLLTSLNLRGSWIKNKTKVVRSKEATDPSQMLATHKKRTQWSSSTSKPSMDTSTGESIPLSTISTFSSVPETKGNFMDLDQGEGSNSGRSYRPAKERSLQERVLVIGRPTMPVPPVPPMPPPKTPFRTSNGMV